MTDVLVVGAGPGVLAALQAAELGARTTLVTSKEFGGIFANDGPVPVRTLAHAARAACARPTPRTTFVGAPQAPSPRSRQH